MSLLHPFIASSLFVLSFCISIGAQERRGKGENSDPTGRMHGEKVLTQKDAPLLNPICRFDEQPWFEIANLRPGKTLDDALVLDFAFAGELPKTPVHVVVLTNGSRHRFPITSELLKKRRGEFACSYGAISDKSPFGANLEAYVELTDAEVSKNYARGRYSDTTISEPLYFKVSKSATLGQVAQLTLAREIRPDEMQIYSARQKKFGPPSEPPDNHKIVDAKLTVVPGTPVLASFEGNWLEAEVLGVTNLKQLIVHWPEFGHARNQVLERTHVAISSSTASKLKSNPDDFKPSVELATGSLQPPEQGFAVLPANVKLYPGVPLKHSHSSFEYTVLSTSGERVTVCMSRQMSFTHEYSRREFIINEEVLEQLKKANAEKEFAQRLEQMQAAANVTSTPTNLQQGSTARSFSRTAIKIAVPESYSKVDEKTPLKEGTSCLVCWGNKWNPVTVLRVLSDGTVEIRWDGWSSTETLPRTDLIISDAILKKLGGKKDVAKSEKKDPKQPTDSSKKFKIILTDAGTSKSQVIRGVMKITDLDLKSVGELIKELPMELASGLTEAEAKEWKSKFEKVGAKVAIKNVD